MLGTGKPRYRVRSSGRARRQQFSMQMSRALSGSVAKLAGRSAWCTFAGNGFGGERAMIVFKGSHFERDVILWAVRWYVAYPISYRQLEEMMEEHGVEVDHATLAILCVGGIKPVISMRVACRPGNLRQNPRLSAGGCSLSVALRGGLIAPNVPGSAAGTVAGVVRTRLVCTGRVGRPALRRLPFGVPGRIRFRDCRGQRKGSSCRAT
jgi:hypothetical protein